MSIIRQTLDSPSAPEVELLFDDGTCTFNGSEWSACRSQLSIFDADFVEKNVYSGAVIRPEQRQSLLEFALGAQAVQLRQQVDTATQKISKCTQEISTYEKSLAVYLKEMQLTDFVAIRPVPDADRQVEALRKRIATANESIALQKRLLPVPLTEPELDLDAFFTILSTTLNTDFHEIDNRQN